MCVNLIPGHRYYEYSVWVIKLGMTPDVMKLYIMPQSLSLCLTRYAWFGKVSSRSLLKWSVGGLARRLLPCVAVEMHPTPELPTFQLLLLPRLVMVVVLREHYLRRLLLPLTPSWA
jgi:hypothetical protein